MQPFGALPLFVLLVLLSPGMAVGRVQAAKRHFVAILLALAEAYHIAVTVTRESSDTTVQKAVKPGSAKSKSEEPGVESLLCNHFCF